MEEGKGKYRPTDVPVGPADAVPARDKARDQPSVDGLKAELFGREVPEEYRILALGETFVRLNAPYSFQLPHDVGVVPGAVIDVEVPDEQLTKFGQFLKSRVKGRSFFDLGASEDSDAEKLAAGLGVGRYIGIDLDFQSNEHARRAGATEFYHVGEDLLKFVSQVKDQVGGVYYLSGLEPYILQSDHRDNTPRKARIEKYCDQLLQEINRTLQHGDILILGIKTGGFCPDKFGFVKREFPELQESKRGYQEELTTRVYIKQ